MPNNAQTKQAIEAARSRIPPTLTEGNEQREIAQAIDALHYIQTAMRQWKPDPDDGKPVCKIGGIVIQ